MNLPNLFASLNRLSAARKQAQSKSSPEFAAAPLASLKEAWQRVLNQEQAPSLDQDFFDSGGDSLTGTLLAEAISERFGRPFCLRDLVVAPTLRELAMALGLDDQLTAADKTSASNGLASASDLTGIEFACTQAVLRCVRGWEGERQGPESLIVGQNTAGKRMPLFWVFQGEEEFLALADELGPDQPLYGMRSGHEVADFTEETTQRLALAYAKELEALRPKGPLALGGNCQGGIIALALAQHLERRFRQVAMLILREWSFGLQSYTGPVALLFGRESDFAEPYRRYAQPELGWRRGFPDHRVLFTSGAHGQFFQESHVSSLAENIRRCLDDATDQVPRLLPKDAKRFQLEVESRPSALSPGEKLILRVRITNSSTVHWPAGKSSGLVLANHWSLPNDQILTRLDGRLPLPPLTPDESTEIDLPVEVPDRVGELRLSIHLVEEGVETWTSEHDCAWSIGSRPDDPATVGATFAETAPQLGPMPRRN